MYYYARKLQKSDRKYKAIASTSISTVNGSNSTCSSNGSPSCAGATVVSPQENPYPSNSQSSHVHRGPNVTSANDWDHVSLHVYRVSQTPVVATEPPSTSSLLAPIP
ncbi:unnamed protein product, partial [Allacma fusca]